MEVIDADHSRETSGGDSSGPHFTPPGNDAATHWFLAKKNVVFVVATVFLLLASAAFFLIYAHEENATREALKKDGTMAGLFALLLDEHFQKTPVIPPGAAAGSELERIVQQAPLAPGISLHIAASRGRLLYSTRLDPGREDLFGPLYAALLEAKRGKREAAAIADPASGGRKRFLSFATAPSCGLEVVVDRESRTILLAQYPHYLELALIILLVFLLAVAALFYFRRNLRSLQAIEKLREKNALQNSELRFRELFDHMKSGVAVYRAVDGGEDFLLLDLNRAGRKIACVTEDCSGRSISELFPGVKEFGLFSVLRQVWKTGRAEFHPASLYRDDRMAYWAENYVYKLPSGEVVAIFDDVTARIQAENTLRESEARYRSLFDHSLDAILLTRPDGAILDANPAACGMFGRSPEEICAVGRNGLVDLTDPRLHEVLKERERSGGGIAELTMLRANGDRFPVEMTSQIFLDEDGQRKTSMIIRDITGRRRDEEVIRQDEARLEGLLRLSRYSADSLQDFLDYALSGAITLTGSRIGYIYFYDDVKKEFQLNTWSKDVMAECRVNEPATFYQLEKTGIWGEAVRQAQPIVVNDFQAPHPLKRGCPEGHVPLQKFMTVPVFSGGRIVAVAGVANKETDYDGADVRQLTLLMDAVWRIAEQKKVELALLAAEEKYRNIVENAQEGIFQTTAAGRFLTANRALANLLGYDSPAELIEAIVDIGQQLYANPDERRRLMELLAEQGQVAGYEAQWVRKDGATIWVTINDRTVSDESGRTLYCEGFVEDVTDRKNSLERIRKALGATVQAIAVTVEAKDPYTAGHQRRVADLSRSIATEMGLSPDRIDGIRIAGMLHDLGKIAVPAEILSKPSRLTAIEFQLIKAHPQAGYDILKDIEFPWPIARMVLEHHERMDGSGYPNNLAGDKLLVESRILAVADVVESMASHRPYRPAIGLAAALDEIFKQRGTLYDPEAVDACLSLFRKGYSLPE